MRRSTLRPEGVAPPTGHFSHGVVVQEAGAVLYVAGQVGLDEEGELVGPDDPAAQATQALTNLSRIVAEAGGRMEDVAKTTMFLVDLAHRQAVGDVRERFFPVDPPANTLLVVSSLARPDLLVEIEAVVPLS
jgi:enamine deaminase RidA (YjgF/YER057c/UK114 family)